MDNPFPHQEAARRLLSVSYEVDAKGRRACRWCANGYQSTDKLYEHDQECEIRQVEECVAFWDEAKAEADNA